MTEEGLKQLLAQLSAKYKKNMDLRLKFPKQGSKYSSYHDYHRFAESEADLDVELKNIQMIAAYPNLLLSFLAMRGVELLMDILNHENPDIFINVVNILSELTEDDMILAEKDNIQFIEYLISKDVPLLLIDTIGRLKMTKDEDLEALYNVLCILENISDYKPEICEYYFKQEKLMKWLTSTITSSEDEINDTIRCACELLSIIIQKSKEAQQNWVKSGDLLEILQEINRRCVGKKEISEDYVENLFSVVCGCLLVAENKDAFREYEGIELMLKLMKSDLNVRRLALKTLDFALGNNQTNCKQLIASLGLSYVFAMFLKKV